MLTDKFFIAGLVYDDVSVNIFSTFGLVNGFFFFQQGLRRLVLLMGMEANRRLDR